MCGRLMNNTAQKSQLAIASRGHAINFLGHILIHRSSCAAQSRGARQQQKCRNRIAELVADHHKIKITEFLRAVGPVQ